MRLGTIGYNIVSTLPPLDVPVAESALDLNRCLTVQDGEVVIKELEVKSVTYRREFIKGKKEKKDIFSIQLHYKVNPNFQSIGQELLTSVKMNSGKRNEIIITFTGVKASRGNRAAPANEVWEPPHYIAPTKIDLTVLLFDIQGSVPITLSIRGSQEKTICSGKMQIGEVDKTIKMQCQP